VFRPEQFLAVFYPTTEELELLFGAAPAGPLPLTIGFLEIVSPVELSITAVYTATDAASNAISIDVEQIEGRTVPVP